MATTLEAKTAVKVAAKTDVFKKGGYDTAAIKSVKVPTAKNGFVYVFIVAPTTKGTYPVLLFCHGYLMGNDWYSDLFHHIASHGYIIVAPQLYGFHWFMSACDEIKRANAVAEWLSTGLLAALQGDKDFNNVYPDVENNLVAAGHSRGGKTAFALALGETCPSKKDGFMKRLLNRLFKKRTSPWVVKESSAAQKFKAVVGIDPVAARSMGNEENPKILQYIPRCFNMSIPVALVGAGLSDKGIVIAPHGLNHAEFFNESKPPVCYFLAKEYGHADMMDDTIVVRLIRNIIASGPEGTYDQMRRATGGVTVAFLRAYVGEEKEEEDLEAIVNDPSIAPVLLDPVLHVVA